MTEIKYYQNRICLNVLASDLENAHQVYQAAEGCVLIGLLSKDYVSTKEAVVDMKRYQKELNNSISVVLGAGDSNQWRMVTEISKEVQPLYINQVFPAVGFTRGVINNNFTNINCLVSLIWDCW
nr:KDGP aldolase [Spiroplasma sp. ChiS]